MSEYTYQEFELDRNESIVIGDDMFVVNVFVTKETVEQKSSKIQLGEDISVETIVRRTVPLARVGVDVPRNIAAHRSEVFNAILEADADRLLPLFHQHGATKEDCMAASRAAKRDFAVATALLAERFLPPTLPQEPTA